MSRIIAYLQTFPKRTPQIGAFAFGNLADKLKTMLPGAGLEIERAIRPAGRQKILGMADHLPVIDGRSCNRRIKTEPPNGRPRRKGYRRRPSQAIVYLLIETGMRRAGVVRLNAISSLPAGSL